ncbi:L-rhamnose mutarotase [Micromonospora fiedleri]|uniref:L-rhamnose mutarotase n=1 Tax=Micromonospora fiedleri TaxID=1157498 RepID=A0ABS1USG7_9ACTN|nr:MULTISPECIES: L-rhamnose mutarotase [Micromonospora]MBL6279303.1 L-rhamnose mutarotase [Micromonospora fiedleri]WSK40075.1 L-rhamnose mutarotase [Micromonospora maris]
MSDPVHRPDPDYPRSPGAGGPGPVPDSGTTSGTGPARGPGTQVCYLYRLRPGAEAEYERRHAELWPEMAALLDEAGMYDYHIYRHGLLLICVLRTRWGFDHARRVTGASPVQARWSASLAHLFAEIADADGEPLWAYPVFHHPGCPPG